MPFSGSGGGTIGFGEYAGVGLLQRPLAFGTQTNIAIPTYPLHSDGTTQEVTALLQAIIDGAPDFTTFVFPFNERYRCEFSLNILGRRNLLFLGNGSEIYSTFSQPYAHVIEDGIITGPVLDLTFSDGAVSTGTTLTSISTFFSPAWNGKYAYGPAGQFATITYVSAHVVHLSTAWTNGLGLTVSLGQNPPLWQVNSPTSPLRTTDKYTPISGDNIFQAARTQGDYSDHRADGFHQIGFAKDTGTPPPLAQDGNGLHIVFQGPNQGRRNFNIQTAADGTRNTNIAFRQLKVTGSNTNGGYSSTYSAALEDQHNFFFEGTDGFELDRCTLTNPWGDFVCMAADAPQGGNQCERGFIHHNVMHTNGRMGITFDGVLDTVVCYNNISDMRRTCYDFEVPTGSSVRNVTVAYDTVSTVHLNWLNLNSYPAGAPADIGDVLFFGIILNTAFQFSFIGSSQKRRGPFRLINIAPSPGQTYLSGNPTGWCTDVEYCDGMEIAGCRIDLQAPRNPVMHILRANNSTGINVHDNTGIGVHNDASDVSIAPFNSGSGKGVLGFTGLGNGGPVAPTGPQGGGVIGFTGKGKGNVKAEGSGTGILGFTGSGRGGSTNQGGGVIGFTGAGYGGPPGVVIEEKPVGTIEVRGPGWDEGPWDVGGWDGVTR